MSYTAVSLLLVVEPEEAKNIAAGGDFNDAFNNGTALFVSDSDGALLLKWTRASFAPNPISRWVHRISITHNFRRELHPEDNICQAGEPAPHDDIAWRRVTLAREISTELGQLDGVVRQRPRHELRDSRLW